MYHIYRARRCYTLHCRLLKGLLLTECRTDVPAGTCLALMTPTGSGSERKSSMQVLRHDISEKKKVGTISEAYPHLIVNQFSSKLGQRVGNILKYLFPAPKVNS